MREGSNDLSFDAVIVGAGFFGLYSALFLAQKSLKVLVIENDKEIFSRASQVNQARVHLGYHYPRSIGTALGSIDFFHRFNNDFKECINGKFDKIYAISALNSSTLAAGFENFCNYLKIPLKSITAGDYFNSDVIEAAYSCQEFSFDHQELKKHLLTQLSELSNCRIQTGVHIQTATVEDEVYNLKLSDDRTLKSRLVINATYAGLNSVLKHFHFPTLPLKYELTEVVLGKVSKNLEPLGITVMDGPFFSSMPFGHSGFHSLTAVDFTPHMSTTSQTPEFPCQNINTKCLPTLLENCTTCAARPKTAAPWMMQIFSNYLRPEFKFEYERSLFTVKTVLRTSEVDDSRPTYISVAHKKPYFMSVFSGKINTVYELENELHAFTQGLL